jgi:hypothetical protein
VKKLTVLLVVFTMVFTTGPAFAGHLESSGQLRINNYIDSKSDNDDYDDENTMASRLRYITNLDYEVNDEAKVRLQLRFGNYDDNVWGQNLGDVGDVRQLYLKAKLTDQITGTIGLIPLDDKFGMTLFSGDWDFAPLSYVFTGNLNDISYRVGSGKLDEGLQGGKAATDGPDDDVNIYLIDVDYMTYGGSIYYLAVNEDPLTGVDTDTNLLVFGARAGHDFGVVNVSGFLMGSLFKAKNALATGDKKSTGYAGKVEVTVPIGSKVKIGVMGLYASGDKDFQDASEDSAGSFITPGSLYGGAGAWGYTGNINVQWPLDTGVDDPVNIDGGTYGGNNVNLGMGMTTIQVNAGFPVIDNVDGYVGAGYFTLNDSTDARDEKVLGTDIYAQASWRIKDFSGGETLTLNAGVDYAMLSKGHHGSATTAGVLEERNKTIGFAQIVFNH